MSLDKKKGINTMNGWFEAWVVIMVICTLYNIATYEDMVEFLGRMLGAATQWAIILLIIRLVVWLFTS